MLHVTCFMRIAFFSDTFIPEINSISISLYTLSQELINRGHDISIFTTGQDENKKGDFDIPELLKIYRTTNSFSDFKRNNSETIHKDFKEILTSKPDIIHVHTPFGIGKQGVRAARLLNIPLIGSHHSFYVNYQHGSFKRDSFISRILLRKYSVWFYNQCKLVIVPSKAIAADLAKSKLSAPLSIIPNPINIKKLQPSALKEQLKKLTGLPEFSIVYFGKITYEKRINELLKVFALLSPKYPKMKLSIVGDGPEKENLQDFARKLNINDRIIFFGLLRGQNFIDVIAANDVFITASDTENQPLPIFEAMALGLPQVVAKSPIDEYVENGVTGFVTQKYSFVEMSEKLAKLIEDPVLRQTMSENSKKAALKYDVGNIAAEYERIYSDFVKS